jgi:hypothetical protein
MKFAIDRGVVDDRWWTSTEPFVDSLRTTHEFSELVSRGRSTRMDIADVLAPAI